MWQTLSISINTAAEQNPAKPMVETKNAMRRETREDQASARKNCVKFIPLGSKTERPIFKELRWKAYRLVRVILFLQVLQVSESTTTTSTGTLLQDVFHLITEDVDLKPMEANVTLGCSQR
ncbi:Uncharacterized protein Rs2_51730 [Raphanus sativus]|nr:Uncharacterized protein Rs2_51730 [Raphanus sativus]